MRKRSSYRPMVPQSAPLAILRPVPKDSAMRAMLRVWTALECLQRGTGRMEELRDMVDVVNIIETSCCNGPRNDGRVLEIVQTATSGLVKSSQHPSNGWHKLEGLALESMRTLAALYSQYVSSFSEHDMALLESLTNRRLAVLRRQSKPQATVIQPQGGNYEPQRI